MKVGLRLGTCLVGGFLLLSLAQARPERNAFLNKAAPNLRSIIRQVKFDPQVLKRYQMHFGLGKWELVAYFEALQLARLKKSASYVVFNSRESDGAIRSRVFHLKKGTKVYVDRFGMPVLKFSCGNPMSRGPVRMLLTEIVAEAPTAPPVEKLPEVQDLPSVPNVPDPVMVVEELAAPAIPVTPPIEPPVTPPTPPTPPEIVKPEFEGPPSWILPLLSGAIIIGHKEDHSRPPVVPEPATIAVLAIGVGMLARRKRQNR